MLVRFNKHIEKNFPYLKTAKLLLAISGGVDSVVLGQLLYSLGCNVTFAHCNFKLREESDADQEFVRSFANQLSVDFLMAQFDTKVYAEKNKLSIQLAARELRYSWFKELQDKYNIDYLLTGHHADDNLETFIINLSRGSGLRGLLGIPEETANIIRPLLPFSREDIEIYAKSNGISWVEDKSNQDVKYLRNKIRHRIVPGLKELSSNFLDNFANSIEYLKAVNSIVEDRLKGLSKEIVFCNEDLVEIKIEKLLELSDPNIYLYHFLKDYGVKEWSNAFDLLKAQPGKKLLTSTHTILRDRENILIYPFKEDIHKEFYIYKEDDVITEPIKLSFSKGKREFFSKKIILIDENLINYPLILRKRRVGDVFYPSGMHGKKKLSKYFKDEKLSDYQKNKVWLLCSGEKIVWVIGMRQDKRFIPKNSNKKNNLIICVL